MPGVSLSTPYSLAMPLTSLSVKRKTAVEFLKGYKDLNCNIDGLKAVVNLSSSLEVTFVSEAALRDFLKAVENTDWEVICDLKTTTIVTLAPRGQGGHALISDEVVVSFLKKYCEVLDGRRVCYKDFPNVQTGVRQFKVKLGEKAMPSSISFGRAAFFLSYKGQEKTCFKCHKAGHQAKDCKEVKCHKCGQEGHEIRDCANQVRCIICDQEGHTFRTCPSSYSRALNLGPKFSKISTTSNNQGENEVADMPAEAATDESKPASTPEPAGTLVEENSGGFSQDSTTESQFIAAGAAISDAPASPDLFISQTQIPVSPATPQKQGSQSKNRGAKTHRSYKRSVSSDDSDSDFPPLVIDEQAQSRPQAAQSSSNKLKEAKRRKSHTRASVSASQT